MQQEESKKPSSFSVKRLPHASNSESMAKALGAGGEAYFSMTHPTSMDPHEPPGPLQAQEVLCLKGKENGVDPGKEITYEYQYQGTVFGKESVERREAIQDLKTSLNKQIGFLSEKLSSLEQQMQTSKRSFSLKSEIQKVKEEMKLCQHSLANTDPVSDDFIKSSFYRDELQKVLKKEGSYTQHVNEICLGAAVNFRYQKCETGKREVVFFRLGVITDPRNGFTHLGELKALQRNPSQLKSKIDELSQEHQRLLKQNSKKKSCHNFSDSLCLNSIKSSKFGSDH